MKDKKSLVFSSQEKIEKNKLSKEAQKTGKKRGRKNTVTKEEDTLLLSSAKALPIVSLRLIAVAPEAMAVLIFFSVLTVLIDKYDWARNHSRNVHLFLF